jgi:hypothetical protein
MRWSWSQTYLGRGSHGYLLSLAAGLFRAFEVEKFIMFRGGRDFVRRSRMTATSTLHVNTL